MTTASAKLVARLMSPLGSYPDQTFLDGTCAFCIAPDLCFSIVSEKPEHYISEVDYVAPEEVPLLIALFLCRDKDQGFVLPFPTQYSVLLPCMNLAQDFDEMFITDAAGLLRGEIVRLGFPCYPDVLHKPLALGGKEYDFITIRNQDANRRTVLRFFQSSQPLYRRGAATLLKANIAWLYSDFREAACFYLWIALDAAFSIICNRLRADGNPNPTAHDAQDFIERLHGDNESSDRKFFEHDYYTRIEAMHPENRYSSVARPLILADDFLELNDSLTDLYYFFATGVVREHL